MTREPFDIFKSYIGHRDYIFRQVLWHFWNKPIDVFQIGGIQNWQPAYRVNSGWSDFFWAGHIGRHGGSLTVCDINPGALDNSKQAFASLAPLDALTMVAMPGEKFLANTDKKYDIYYLDGSDDPQEMYDQFQLIEKRPGIVIMCDDWRIKGTLLAQSLEEKDGLTIEIHDAANGVAVLRYS